MKFKRFKVLGQFTKSQIDEIKRLSCEILIASDKTPTWSNKIKTTVDTGADYCVFPKKLIDNEGLEYEVIDDIPLTMADGSTSIGQLVNFKIRVLTAEPINRDVLVDVPCVLSDTADECLLGLSLLRFYTYIANDNELRIIRQNELFQKLEDVPFETTTLKISSSNIIPPPKQPSALTYPKPLSPPAATKPRKGAFLPPLKPKGRNMPK